jgi:hypothetical protein
MTKTSKTPCPVCNKMTSMTKSGRAFHGYSAAGYGKASACVGTYGRADETAEQAHMRAAVLEQA